MSKIGEERLYSYSSSSGRIGENTVDISSELSAKQQEINIFETQISTIETDSAELESTRIALQDQLSTEQEAVSSAQSAVSSAQSALASASEGLSSAQSALQSAQSISVKRVVNEDGSVVIDSSARDAAIAEAQAQVTAAQEEYEAAQTELESAQAELETLQINVSNLENQINQIDIQMQSVAAEQQSAEAQLSVIEAEYAVLEARLQEANEENIPEPTLSEEPEDDADIPPSDAEYEVDIPPEDAVYEAEKLTDNIDIDSTTDAEALLDNYISSIFGTNTDSNDEQVQTVEDAMLSAIEAELEKQRKEVETESDSKSGLGKLWNGAKGLFGGGTKGELNDISELQEIYSELKNNPDTESVTALYKSVFGTEPDMAALRESINTAGELKSGSIVLSNGEEVTQKDIADAINEQVASLASNFDDTVDSQGIFTKLISGANNFIGIGTTENMTKAQLDTYQDLAKQLSKTDDPEEFASLYKSITGEELTSSSLDGLFEGSSKVENSKAVESMMDYEETNENIKNTAIAVGVGVATACTGGVAGAVAVGVGATVAVNTIDAVTQDNCEDIVGNLVDYAKTDLVKDVCVGAINGLTGKLGNMAGEKLVSTFAGTAGKGLTNEAAKATLSAGKRIITEFADGAVDAGLSSAAEYVVDSAAGVNGNFTSADGNFFNDNGGIALFDNLIENFDAKEMAEQTIMSTIMGGVMSVGMQEGMGLLKKGLSSSVSDAPENVKMYSGMDEAQRSSLVGDICQIADSEHVGIKLSNGNIEELGISAETFNKLFPDGCEINVKQGQIGDCYLVSSIYSLMSNPETSPVVLKCFTENADGSITVKLPEGSVEFTFDPGKLTSDYVSSTKISDGSEGARMLEYVYGLELLNNQKISVQDSISEQLSLLQSFSDSMDSYKNFLELEGSVIDIDQAKKLIDELPYGGDTKVGDFYERYREPIYGKFLNQTEDGGMEINFDFVRSRIDSYETEIGRISKELDNLRNASSNLDIDTNMAEQLRGNGGYMSDVFSLFGLDAYYMNISDDSLKLFTDSSNWSDYILGAGTKGANDTVFLNKDLDIAGRHAYSIKPVISEADGSINIEITNPWHTNQHEILTLDEFKEYFSHIYYAKIK